MIKSRVLVFLFSVFFAFNIKSQDTTHINHSFTYKDVQSRSRDHLMFQFGYVGWTKVPDSVHVAGFNRQFKIYGMYDILIKGFPYMSIGIGASGAWDNVYFNDTKLDISKNSTNAIIMNKRLDKERFEKSKITTFYFDFPLELRYTSNPRNYNRAFKMAVGLSYGLLFQAYSKSENLLDATGTSVKNSTIVESDSRYFNGSRIMLNGRIGWGFFHLYGSYQLNDLFTNVGGPSLQTYSFGIGINGL